MRLKSGNFAVKGINPNGKAERENRDFKSKTALSEFSICFNFSEDE